VAGEIAVFDEETALDVLRTIEALKASGLLEPTTSQLNQGLPGSTAITSPAPVFVYNDSGEVVPPYSLMQMTGTLNETGRNYVKVDKPIDSTLLRCPMLINGHTEIPVEGYGMAQNGPVYRLKMGVTIVVGDRLGAKTGQWTADYGSLFTVIGSDEIDTDVARVMFDTSTLRGRTKTGGLVVGSPSAVLIYDAAGTLTSREYVAETFVSNIAANTDVVMFPLHGRWLALGLC